MIKILFLICKTIIGLYVFLCIFMYFFQDQLLFFPSAPYLPHYEKLAKNPVLENIKLQTPDGASLDGWRQKYPDRKYMILYFGGNGDETSYFVEKYNFKNANIISFNYRGYAYSTGKPSEQALFADALLQYDYLIDTLHISPENIIVMGRSLGTGVAVYLSSQRKVQSVILITPYDSVESVAKESYFFVPVSLLLKNKFLSTRYSSIQKNNLLCIYGGGDTTIPNHHTENLLSHWNGSIKKILIPNADHNNIQSFPEFMTSIDEFLAR